jgi:hypothetical protein
MLLEKPHQHHEKQIIIKFVVVIDLQDLKKKFKKIKNKINRINSFMKRSDRHM